MTKGLINTIISWSNPLVSLCIYMYALVSSSLNVLVWAHNLSHPSPPKHTYTHNMYTTGIWIMYLFTSHHFLFFAHENNHLKKTKLYWVLWILLDVSYTATGVWFSACNVRNKPAATMPRNNNSCLHHLGHYFTFKQGLTTVSHKGLWCLMASFLAAVSDITQYSTLSQIELKSAMLLYATEWHQPKR